MGNYQLSILFPLNFLRIFRRLPELDKLFFATSLTTAVVGSS